MRFKFLLAKTVIIQILTLVAFSAHAADLSTKPNIESEEVSNKFYVGVEGGFSVPAAKGFKDKNSNTEITMKRSYLYIGSLGYEFYPGMYLEFNSSHRPNFKTGIILPNNYGNGTTRSKARIHTLNLAYDLMELAPNVKPFIILGAGLAEVSLAKKEIINPDTNFDVFKVLNKKSRSLAWQIGGGISAEISPRVKLNLAAKFHVVNNVKLHYESRNKTTFQYEKGRMKKTIAVGEFTMGIDVALF